MGPLRALTMTVLALALLTRAHAHDDTKFKKPSSTELKAKLTPMQFKVTQEQGTEPPFDNTYWHNKDEGIYVDVVSGEPLFSSKDKFDSGTGWPSFTRPLVKDNLVERKDHELGEERTEVRSRHADSHLGHVFDDGPPPTGLRYCMNSAALRFVPKAKLKDEGYGEFLKEFDAPPSTAPKKDKKERKPNSVMGVSSEISQALDTATFAAGCFWGTEEFFRKIDGVVETKVGYTGGHVRNPKYDDTSTGETGHAESVQVKFDPRRVSYQHLVELFFKMHDPTTLNRQGNDEGTQYRSAIFYHGDEQKKIIEQVEARIVKAHAWNGLLTTQVAPAQTFYPAEDYHQKYLVKHPGGYDNHYLRKIDF